MSFLKKLILPSGKYNPLYINYLKWSFTSNVFASAQTAIVADNMLCAINSDSEINRTINYVGKDIIGQLGGLFVLSKVGDKADKNPRNFLMYSNIVQQLGFVSVSLTPMIPTYFLPIAVVSSVLTNLSFTGFGAVNAKCINKLSMGDDVAELYSKITIVNTLGSSLGLFLGLGINIMIPDHLERSLIIPFLGLARVYTYNKAIEKIL